MSKLEDVSSIRIFKGMRMAILEVVHDNPDKYRSVPEFVRVAVWREIRRCKKEVVV